MYTPFLPYIEQKLMRSLSAFSSIQVIDSASFSTAQLARNGGGFLAVSQSGETKTLLDALQTAQANDVPAFSVVNGVGSRIAQTTKIGAYQNAGPEIAITSTKSFTTQVTVIALIACWFAQHREDASEAKRIALVQALQRLPSSMKAALGTRQQCQNAAKLIKDADSCFVIGSGTAAPIAAEGALKLRELSYLHARACSGPEEDAFRWMGQNDQVPFVFIILDNSHAPALQQAAAKVGH